MPRYTEPAEDVALLLHQLKLTLPGQPPPRIAALPDEALAPLKCSADLGELPAENKRVSRFRPLQLRK